MRERLASAATVPTLWLTAGCFGLLALSGYAPSWWSARNAVVAPEVTTNDGVVTTNYVPNDYAAATQGQLKQFTARAVDELNADLTNSALTNGYEAGPALSGVTAATAGYYNSVVLKSDGTVWPGA